MTETLLLVQVRVRSAGAGGCGHSDWSDWAEVSIPRAGSNAEKTNDSTGDANDLREKRERLLKQEVSARPKAGRKAAKQLGSCPHAFSFWHIHGRAGDCVHSFETFCTQAYNCRLSRLDHALQSRPSSPHFYGGTDSIVRGSRASLAL